MKAVSKRLLTALFIVLASGSVAFGQLCTGSLGDPVVNITFGAGPNPGPKLAAATTSYQYVNYNCPNDGYYTVVNSSSGCFGNSWHTVSRDHTGDPNGYFMLVNASFEPSDFYLGTVDGLCSNTTYEFAAWILNILNSNACIVNGSPNGIRPNITFSIETTSGVVIQKYNTADIYIDAVPTWRQYGFFFKTPAGVNSVVLRMTNNAPGGCGNDLALDDITFRPCGPKVTATINGGINNSSTTICQGATTVLNFTTTISSGYTNPSYQWQLSTDSGVHWNDIPGATKSSFSRQPTVPGYYLYRTTVAETGNIGIANCRISSNVLTISAEKKAVLTTTNNGPVCENTTLILTSSGSSSYLWTGPNGLSASGKSVSIPMASILAGGKYYVLAQSAGGCLSYPDSTVAVIVPAPIAKFIVATPACPKNILDFTDQSTAVGQTILKWTWDFGDGGTAGIQYPSHSYDVAGIYNAKLTVVSDLGCASTAPAVPLTIHPLPVVAFGLPGICISDPYAQFSDSTTIADNTESSFTYSWDFGDAANPVPSSQKNPQHHYSRIGNYSVNLAVVSGNGCISDTTEILTVNGANPKSSFTIDNSASLCSNQVVAITDHSTVDFGNIVKVEIYWDYANDPTQKTVDESPQNNKQYSFQYTDFGTPATKNFQIRYVAYSGINCVNESTLTATVKASPKIQFDNLSSVCEELSPFLITQASETNGFAGTGVYSGDGTSTDGNFDPRQAGPGLHTIRYTFNATNGCSAFAEQPINVYPQPKADAGGDETSLEGGFVTLNGSGSGNNITYYWSPDTAISDRTIPTPRVSPSNDITYTLKVTSADGCVDSDQVVITVLKKPIVPNAFSPNGDGINDVWLIRYLNTYPGAEIHVYNRYGQLVYQSTGYQQPWDGTYKGQPLPVATYYWIINPHNGRTQMNGSVTIIR